jgi:hypothetical protein
VVRTNTVDHSDLVVNVGVDQTGLVVVVHAFIRKENSPARVTASGIYGISGRLSHRLANTEQVSFAISEPRGLFSDTAATRIIARYLRNAVNSLEARQIVLLEYDTACPQLRDGRWVLGLAYLDRMIWHAPSPVRESGRDVTAFKHGSFLTVSD